MTRFLLTLLFCLILSFVSAQTTVVTGPKKKQQTTAPAKPKPTTPAAKPQAKQTPKTNSKPQAKQSSSGYNNGHEWVDLGLSVKWATMNVGASSPTDYGGYFAWGETYTKSAYSWGNYFDSVNGSNYVFSKYATNKKTVMELSDDAARANWGGSWRMPTKAEQDELREKCTWTWIIKNDVKGYQVSSKHNGNSIFLPAAGCLDGDLLDYVGSSGGYWSSSLYTSDSGGAYLLDFSSGKVDWYYSSRFYGLSVRAVCP